MKSEPIVPATIEWDAEGPPRAPAFGDRYHPRVGAFEQAREVFLRGNGLPQRWRGRCSFTILETGFGLGNNFLATWQAWCDDPARPARLHFVSIEAHPPARADLERAQAASPTPALARALIDRWPPLVPGLHSMDFEGGRIRLLLALGDVTRLLPALRLAADAVFLDGFAPDRNPAMWGAPVLKAIARRCTAGATAATWCAASAVRDGLRRAGFVVQSAPGIGGKREITLATRTARPPPSTPASPPERVLVVGAGIAGASVAHALAGQGIAVTVIDRSGVASGASGNPAALVHGVVHHDDGPYARLHRSAALFAARRYGELRAGGAMNGFLRLADESAFDARIARQRLPADYVEAQDATAACRRAGVALRRGAWHFPSGGWVAAPELVAALLDHPAIDVAIGHEIAGLERTAQGWRLAGHDGDTIDEASTVVLANGAGAAKLAQGFGVEWPLQVSRGQVTLVQARTGLALPLAGDGYAIPLLPDRLLVGATQQRDDSDPTLRDEDQHFNLDRASRLLGLPLDAMAVVGGRVAWRVHSADRLPVAGPLALPGACETQARRLPRLDGLFALTALGSRGFTLAPLLGELIAAQITGAPWSLEQDLVDAIDPGRWQVRAARRA